MLEILISGSRIFQPKYKYNLKTLKILSCHTSQEEQIDQQWLRVLENILFLVALCDTGLPALCLSLDLGLATALKLCSQGILGTFSFLFWHSGITTIQGQLITCELSGNLTAFCCLHTLRPEFDKNIFTDGRMFIIKQIRFFTIFGHGWWDWFKMYADLSQPQFPCQHNKDEYFIVICVCLLPDTWHNIILNLFK